MDKIAWSKAVVLVNVVLIAVVAVAGIRYSQRDQDPDPERALEVPAATASSFPQSEEPTAEATTPVEPTDTSQTEPPPATPPEVPAADVPRVKPTMRSNFAKGDGWPVGAGFRESGKLAWPLGVVDRLMTHGPAEGPDAVSWLEKWTKTDVRLLGARVLFAPNHSGAVALTSWHTSVLAGSGPDTPRTGMRLVAEPGTWSLVVLDGQGAATLTSRTFEHSGRSATFTLVRRGATLWVTDPSGQVTTVTDERVATLSGPWASWELREDQVGKRPAAFQEIWAG